MTITASLGVTMDSLSRDLCSHNRRQQLDRIVTEFRGLAIEDVKRIKGQKR